MARRGWTSQSLPVVPDQVNGLTEVQLGGLRAARDAAHDALVAHETALDEAARLRDIRNRRVEHFKTLLEELTSDTLFELESP